MDRDVAVLNRSTVAIDEEVERIAGALQQQVDRDFAPAWGVRTSLTFLPKGVTDGWQGRWNVVVLDTSDEANALGYHDLTPDGLPLGKCFAKTDQMVGAQLSVTMSHELLEMLGDPDVNLQAADENGRIYAYETCDAVEADDIGYEIDGVLISDFVFPEWFVASLRGHDVQFDQQRKVSEPFELAVRCLAQLIVRHDQPAGIADRLDLPGDPGGPLAPHVIAPQGREALHQAPRRIDLQVLALGDRAVRPRMDCPVAGARRPVGL